MTRRKLLGAAVAGLLAAGLTGPLQAADAPAKPNVVIILLDDTGFAGLVGAGWEVRVGRRVYLNPAVDLIQHRYTGRGGERYRERIVNFGIGVLFQSGR